MTVAPRKRVEKDAQPLDVDRPVGRQLKQHRTERPTETIGASEEAMERLLRILQLLHVGQEAARLDRVGEPARRAASPRGEGRRIRKAVEGVVDLDGVEMRRVMLKPLPLRHAARIEIAAPVLVLPPGTADARLAISVAYPHC